MTNLQVSLLWGRTEVPQPDDKEGLCAFPAHVGCFWLPLRLVLCDPLVLIELSKVTGYTHQKGFLYIIKDYISGKEADTPVNSLAYMTVLNAFQRM